MENKKRMKKMREGWTMIELIFVIVVIAILAVAALPRLAATKNDALLSADVSNMATCISDAAWAYTAQMIDFSEENKSLACESVICYKIQYAIKGENFNVTTDPGAADFCEDVEYLGGHLAKNYNFGGSRIVR